MHANILRLLTWTSYIKFSMLVTFDISICGQINTYRMSIATKQQLQKSIRPFFDICNVSYWSDFIQEHVTDEKLVTGPRT